MRYVVGIIAEGLGVFLVVHNREWLMWTIGKLDLFWLTIAVASVGIVLLILADTALLDLFKWRLFSARHFFCSWFIGFYSAVAGGICLAVAMFAANGLLTAGVVGLSMVAIQIIYVGWQERRLHPL